MCPRWERAWPARVLHGTLDLDQELHPQRSCSVPWIRAKIVLLRLCLEEQGKYRVLLAQHHVPYLLLVMALAPLLADSSAGSEVRSGQLETIAFQPTLLRHLVGPVRPWHTRTQPPRTTPDHAMDGDYSGSERSL